MGTDSETTGTAHGDGEIVGECGGGWNVNPEFISSSSSLFFFVIGFLTTEQDSPDALSPSHPDHQPIFFTPTGEHPSSVDTGGTEKLTAILGAEDLLRAAASVRRLRTWIGGRVNWTRVVVDLGPATCGGGFELALRLSDTKQNMGWCGWKCRQ